MILYYWLNVILKEESEIKELSFKVCCNDSNHNAAENWKDQRPKEVRTLGVQICMKLLERRLRLVLWILRSDCKYDGVFQ